MREIEKETSEAIKTVSAFPSYLIESPYTVALSFLLLG